MNNRKELKNSDIKVLDFVARYKIMRASDTIILYKSERYRMKRIRELVSKRYLKRIGRLYLRLDYYGIKAVKTFGNAFKNNNRDLDYIERLKAISRIAATSLESITEFIPSWELKDKNEFTIFGRKKIGDIIFSNIRRAAYYINKNKGTVYIKQVINDITKDEKLSNIVVFTDNFNIIQKQYSFFKFNKKSLLIINNTKVNRRILRNYHNISYHEITEEIYKVHVFLSDIMFTDFMIDSNHYISFMPFIDISQLFIIKDSNSRDKIDILTLKENEETIKKLYCKAKLIFIDEQIGGQIEGLI